MCADIDGEAAEAVAAEIGHAGGHALGRRADVLVLDDLTAIAQASNVHLPGSPSRMHHVTSRSAIGRDAARQSR